MAIGILYVWTGSILLARVVADNPQPLEMLCDVHLTVAGMPEQVKTVTVPANTAVTVDFPGYTFTAPGIYPAGGYISEAGNPSNVYAAIVAERNLEVLESQLTAIVDWV